MFSNFSSFVYHMFPKSLCTECQLACLPLDLLSVEYLDCYLVPRQFMFRDLYLPEAPVTQRLPQNVPENIEKQEHRAVHAVQRQLCWLGSFLLFPSNKRENISLAPSTIRRNTVHRYIRFHCCHTGFTLLRFGQTEGHGWKSRMLIVRNQ